MASVKKIGFLSFLLFILWSCTSEIERAGNLLGYIPENAELVVKLSDFDSFKAEFDTNPVLAKFQQTEWYKLYTFQQPFLKEIHPTSQSILAFVKENDSVVAYTFVTKDSQGLFVTDSINDKKIETLTREKLEYQRVTLGSAITYTKRMDSLFIASSSETLLQEILLENQEHQPAFTKLFKMQQSSDIEILKKHFPIPAPDASQINMASWSRLDTKLLIDGVSGSGIVLARDSVPQLLSVFKGQVPQKNEIARVTPTEVISATAFTFNDAVLFQQKLRAFDSKNTSKTTLFETISEVGNLTLKTGNAIAIKSIDPSLTQDDLAGYISEKAIFRDVQLYDFSEPFLFSETFAPLLPRLEMNVAFQLDDYFLFTETEELANRLIIAFKNNDVLSQTRYFEETTKQLSSASSLLHYQMDGDVNQALNNLFLNTNLIKTQTLKGYPLIGIQLTFDRDFAHLSLACREASATIKNSSASITSKTISVEKEILGNPQFFSNHKTSGQDIVVQDVANTLHLYSISGKKGWSKELDGPILGAINEVDVLRNGKKQMAFATKNTFYVLDRNGNSIDGFPIKFKDDITQPLAVFDYDNNRKYRFLVTQDAEVYMYDVKGKRVRGFSFTKAKSEIAQQPLHIRMATKDYIIIAEKSGRLNILSRTGTARVTVDKRFNFSEVPVTKEGARFIVITEDKKKVLISTSGKINEQKLNVSPSYWFATSGVLKVTMDDNLLRINNKLVELPLGIYTKPQLFLVNRTTYITVTETQENKVYVVGKDGSILPKFPLFGISEATLVNRSRNGKPALLTKGDAKEILLYTF